MKKITLTSEEVSQLCTQLALLQSAGDAYDDALDVISRDAPAKIASVLHQAGEALNSGCTLAQALEQTGAFPEYMVQMVEIGQISGTMDRVFPALAEYYQREAELSASIRRTAVYPAMLAAMIAAVFLVLITQVLPVFQQVFVQLGMELSPAAQTLLNLGSASRTMAIVLAPVLALCALILLWMLYTPAGKQAAGRLSNTVAARSASGRERARSRFAGAMHLMLSSGLGLDESMERARKLLAGGALQSELDSCMAEMDKGESFPKAVENAGVFSEFDCGLLAAAFRAGAGEKGLSELAGRCARRAETSLESLLNRCELILVVVLCVAVGLVLLSVMLPLLGVMTTIGG